MIISHKLGVIYIKLKKVASTSFEFALSKYCASGDVITMLGREYDEERELLGLPKWERTPSNEELISLKDRPVKFQYGHQPAAFIKERISPDIWDSYMKIVTIRNPYERMISRYYDDRRFINGKKSEMKPFGHAIRRAKKRGNMASFLYNPIHIDGKSVIDFYIRYEHLIEDVKKLEVKIGCPGLSEAMQQFSCWSGHRPRQGASLCEMYSKYPEAKSMIDKNLYENIDKYELLRDHWLPFKSELEAILNGGEQKHALSSSE